MTEPIISIRYKTAIRKNGPLLVMAVLAPSSLSVPEIAYRVDCLCKVLGHWPVGEDSVAYALDALVERRLVTVVKGDSGPRYALGDVVKAKHRVEQRKKEAEDTLDRWRREGRTMPGIMEVEFDD